MVGEPGAPHTGFDEPQPEILYDFDELIWFQKIARTKTVKAEACRKRSKKVVQSHKPDKKGRKCNPRKRAKEPGREAKATWR